MAKYRVSTNSTCRITVWEGEAKDKADAEHKADMYGEWYPQLCWQCSNTVELDDLDMDDLDIEKVED